MLNKSIHRPNNQPCPPFHNKYQSLTKHRSFEPRVTLPTFSSFPTRYTKNACGSGQQEGSMRGKQVSMEQIKSKLKEYLNKTQESSLLNYQNESMPQFIKKSIHQHFRTTLFRSNIKKKNNFKAIECVLPQRFQSPEFNISEACINPRNRMNLDISNKLFHPKREYHIHHHKKQKIPIPRPVRPPTMGKSLNLREVSFNEKVEPWKRWRRESEEGEMQNDL